LEFSIPEKQSLHSTFIIQCYSCQQQHELHSYDIKPPWKKVSGNTKEKVPKSTPVVGTGMVSFHD
jgi:hypothetical protein